ncbi:MAG: DUF58 domain-containing protein [Candidatus Dadabacteria bacterium]|nr:MAG: DUF58 domain-containing protein [Candidatus Dadabacteria bacterium]
MDIAVNVLTEQKYIKHVAGLSFLTGRGLLLVITAILLLLGPASSADDVIATVISYTTLALAGLLLLVTILRGTHLKKEAGVILDTQQNSEVLYSNTKATFIIRATGFNIPPFYLATIRLNFAVAPDSGIVHELTGYSESLRYIPETRCFPHRGDWTVTSVSASFGDRLGLSRISWEIPANNISFRVHPPVRYSTRIPVLSSAHRAGDLLSDRKEHTGDPYDIKRYHPSDGMKKILWKIYAKTGELMSRHPERAMTPEGQLVIYALCGKKDDHVCSALITYLNYLENMDLDICLGCAGMGAAEPAQTPQAAEELLIESVWAAEKDSADTIFAEINHLMEASVEKLQRRTIDQLVIFGTPEDFYTKTRLELYLKVGEHLEALSVVPVFVLIEKMKRKEISPQTPGNQAHAGIFSRLLFEQEHNQTASQVSFMSDFTSVCAGRNWQVIID